MPLSAFFALALAAAPPQTLPAARLRDDIAAAIGARLRASRSTARIVAIDGLRDQPLPPGEMAIEIGTIAGRWPRARAGVPVRLVVDGRPMRTITAWVLLDDLRSVLTYGIANAARTPASALRLARGDVDMTCCVDAPVQDAAEIATLRLRRAVRAGEPVLASDFEPMPAVAARTQVDIEVEQGPVRLHAPGIALADGGLGACIPVRPEGAQSAVTACVIATGKVRIDDAFPR